MHARPQAVSLNSLSRRCQVLHFGRNPLLVYSTVVAGNLGGLESSRLNDMFCVIGFVRVAGQKPILDVLYNDAAKLRYSGSSLI